MNRPAAVLLALSLSGAAAKADVVTVVSDVPSVRLMHLWRAASGGAALDAPEAFRETGTLAQDDGPASPYETFGDLRTLRTRSSHTVDGKLLTGGFDGKLSWRIDPSGQVSTAGDASTLRGERLGTWLTLSGYLHPQHFPTGYHYLGRRQLRGRSYDVVLATPLDADAAQLWFDRRTHRLGHIEATTEGARIVGDASDYRLVAGTWVAFALDIEQAGHLTHLRIGSFTYIPLAQAQLAPPAGALP